MMMSRPLSCLLLLLVLPWPALAFEDRYQIAPVPAWVQERSLPATLPLPASGYPSDVVLRDRQVLLGDEPVRYARDVLRPLTAAGISGASELSIGFNPAFQHLQLHRLVIWRKGAARDVTATARIRLVQREESLDNGIQDGQVTALISPDDVRVGDLVDLSYSVLGRNPIFARNAGFLALELETPISELSIRLIGSRNQALRVQVFGGKLPVTQEKKNGVTEYRVQLRDVKAVQEEPDSPPWQNGYRWLEYSEYSDWRDVVNWGTALYNLPAGAAPAFDAVYAQLAAAATSPEDFVSRALRYTQDEIRYLGLEFGENSHRPNAPELVIERKFGDCKDKSLLLTALLRRHGITAAPAIVATSFRYGLADTVASPGLFDHVITRVQLNGKQYWLDGTRLYQTGHLDTLGGIDYGYALVLDGNSTGLTRMYANYGVPLSTELEEHYDIKDFSGPVRMRVQTRYYGLTAEWYRYQFSNTPVEALQKQQLDYYSRFHDGIRSTALPRYEDDAENNVLTMYEEYEIPAFWRRAEQRIGGTVLLLAFDGVLEKPKAINRRNPLLLSQPRYISSKTYMHFPTDVMLKLDPAVTTVDGGSFSYSFKDRYYDNTYYHQAELAVTRLLVPAADMPRFMAGLKAQRDDMEYTLSFPDPDKAGFGEITRLRGIYSPKAAKK